MSDKPISEEASNNIFLVTRLRFDFVVAPTHPP